MLKIWSFLKNYSKIILFLTLGVIGIFLFRRKHQTLQNLLDEIQELKEDHREELKEIDREREKERKAYKENEENLKLALDVVRKKYEESQLELSSKKEKEIQKIVKEYGKDPDELAKQLSSATGFKIIPPELN
jgi:hypothetical protein